MSVRNRLLLDVALFAAIVIAYAPAATGTSIHEWLSVAIAVPALLHLVLNWDWVIRFAKNVFGRLTSSSILNATVDAMLFVSAVAVVLSGLLISQVIAGTLGIETAGTQLWRTVHSLSADTTIALLFVHFALHARWMAAAFQSALRNLDPSEGQAAAVPVSDYLPADRR